MENTALQTLCCDGKTIYRIDRNGRGHAAAATLLWCAQQRAQNDVLKLAQIMDRDCGDTSWRLFAIEARDWFADYSPWPASGLSAQNDFSGGGCQTLQWLIGKGASMLWEDASAPCFIGGYSLAGLFALWAFYESGIFDGVASCSGSLWYPGWREYAESARAAKPSCMYLSLGKREPATRHPLLSQVGRATEMQLAGAQADSNITDCILEWNSGGHFTQPLSRMARGFCWLLDIKQ